MWLQYPWADQMVRCCSHFGWKNPFHLRVRWWNKGERALTQCSPQSLQACRCHWLNTGSFRFLAHCAIIAPVDEMALPSSQSSSPLPPLATPGRLDSWDREQGAWLRVPRSSMLTVHSLSWFLSGNSFLDGTLRYQFYSWLSGPTFLLSLIFHPGQIPASVPHLLLLCPLLRLGTESPIVTDLIEIHMLYPTCPLTRCPI